MYTSNFYLCGAFEEICTLSLRGLSKKGACSKLARKKLARYGSV
ncbi:hypothetical protein Hanom_Chr10g00925491 [Helianthus anomalus]